MYLFIIIIIYHSNTNQLLIALHFNSRPLPPVPGQCKDDEIYEEMPENIELRVLNSYTGSPKLSTKNVADIHCRERGLPDGGEGNDMKILKFCKRL